VPGWTRQGRIHCILVLALTVECQCLVRGLVTCSKLEFGELAKSQLTDKVVLVACCDVAGIIYPSLGLGHAGAGAPV